MGLRRFGIFGVSVLFVLLIGTTVMAQAYKVTLAPIFRPGVQLVSDGADQRFVEVDLIARSNIEYWAVQINCTVNKAVLDSPYFVPGSVWNGAANPVVIEAPFNAATGMFSVTVSMVNPSTPIGGGDAALLLGTMNFHVKNLTAAATSTFVCTSSFLDRNGVVVAPTTYVAPAPLSILKSYQIAGTVTYQGRAAAGNAGIKVTCGNNTPVLTAATGAFVINGRAAVTMNCVYENAADRAYLSGRTTVTVGQGGVRIPPVQLPGGNTVDNVPATYNGEVIDVADLGLVTSNFGTGTTLAQGNINGDAKTDQADLALVASNFDRIGEVRADHLLVTYARDYASTANRRAFLVNNATQTLTQSVAGTSKIYDAQLSPDGTKIAYVSEVTPGVPNLTNPTESKLARFALFVAPAPGLAGAPVRLTPVNWGYDAFAPSWSPDSTMLVFVCSKNGGQPLTTDWFIEGAGNLCTVNPGGQNLSIRTETSELWPPTWYDNDGVIYADPLYPGDPMTISYASIRGGMFNMQFPFTGSLPIWRGNTLFYVNSSGSSVIATSSGDPMAPLALPPYPTTASQPDEAFNTDIPSINTGSNDIETYDVSDTTNVIFMKPYRSSIITVYQYNADPVNPDAAISGSIQLPQYAYIDGCTCVDPTSDSIDYTP